MMVLLAIAVFTSAFGIDFAHAKYARERDHGNRWIAATWGLVQWSCASVGFYVAVSVSMAYLPFEAAGLFVGTVIGAPRHGR